MRWLALAGLVVVSCLPPRSDPIDPVPQIFLDFPELAQWGRAVHIGGREYWRPEVAAFTPAGHVVPLHEAWMPYGNGYFYDDAMDGLVWVSLDPWGFITAHYGYWRHHEQLGAVWRPFYPLTWRPFVATILYDDRGVILGMCPYDAVVWEHGLYDLGYGFDDSYWAPYWSRVNAPGFYAQHRSRFDDYCVSVTFYEAERHRRSEPESHHRRDRDYREHRRQAGAGDDEAPRQGERSRGGEASDTEDAGRGLPARPVASPVRERDADDVSPRTPAGLPAIPGRELHPQRDEGEREDPPSIPIQAGELAPAATQLPARARAEVPLPGTAPPAREVPAETPAEAAATLERGAAPAVEPNRTAMPVIEPGRNAPSAEQEQDTTRAVRPHREATPAPPGTGLVLPTRRPIAVPSAPAKPPADSVHAKPVATENRPASKASQKVKKEAAKSKKQ